MALCLLRNVAKGMFMYNFNIKVFFELTHLTIKAIVTVIVSTFYQFIHLYFQTKKQKFIRGVLPQFSHCQWYS